MNRSLLIRPATILPLLWLAAVIVGAAAAPLLTPFDPNAQDLTASLSLSSATHPLGTDMYGRDVLARLLYGGRISLAASALAVVIAIGVGVPLGLVAGFRGRLFDAASLRVIELIQAVPTLIVLLAGIAVVGRNIFIGMAIFGVVVSPIFYRLARDVARSVSAEAYVDAARVSGIAPARILLRHIAPAVLPPTLVQASIVFGMALLTESALNFLGLGTTPPTASWGGLIADANLSINQQPWLIVPPGIVIALSVLSVTYLGDQMRAALRGSTPAGAPWIRTVVPQRPTLEDGPLEDDVTLAVRDLSVTAAGGSRMLLDDIGFDLHRRERLALVGESGSGKTMTAMAILGLLPAGTQLVSASVRLRDQQLVGLSERQLTRVRGRRLAYIGQEPMSALDPTFRVLDQVAESLRYHRGIRGAQARRRVIELLTDVGIRDPQRVSAQYPHQLSGGMAQRVVIAMALACEPEILIADEPTTALDVTVQAEILGLIRGLCEQRGMSLIIVTHDFGVVADIATSAIVMRAGAILESASVEALFAAPTHPYTRALLAANPHGSVPHTPLPVLDDFLAAVPANAAETVPSDPAQPTTPEVSRV